MKSNKEQRVPPDGEALDGTSRGSASPSNTAGPSPRGGEKSDEPQFFLAGEKGWIPVGSFVYVFNDKHWETPGQDPFDIGMVVENDVLNPETVWVMMNDKIVERKKKMCVVLR